MAGRQRFSQREVIDALRQTRGLVTFAAQHLHCDPDTVTNYCRRYPAVAAARDAGRGRQLDIAEAKLFEAIGRGESWAVQFFLRSLGKHRGYGDHVQLDAQVSLVQAPEWLRTRALLLEALRPYPDAAQSVASRLRLLEAPHGDGGDDAG